MTYRLSLLLVATLGVGLFTACGGGSANKQQSPPPQSGQAQGVYEGTLSSGDSFDTIVLPNDNFYALYGTYSGDIFSIQGFVFGSGAESGTSFSGSLTDFESPGTPVGTANLSATFVVGSSLNGSLTEGGQSVSFTASVPSTTQFNYNTAAQAASIAGQWNGNLLDGESATVTIDGTGNVTGLSSLGCSFSGTRNGRQFGQELLRRLAHLRSVAVRGSRPNRDRGGDRRDAFGRDGADLSGA